MTMNTLVPIAVALTLALGAFPAVAKHPSHDRPEARLMRLAHELREATHEVYAGAFKIGPHRCHRHWRAVFALQSLDRNARSFHWTVKREGPHDRDTRGAFHRLERSYRTAQHFFPELRGRRGLHRELARVERLMHSIDSGLAQYAGRHRRDHRWRHPRHDDWRYGDRNDDAHSRWHVSWAFDF